MKQRTELHTFTREQILQMCSFYAKMNIIGSLFVGELGEPEAKFLPDGSVEVRTQVTENDLATKWAVPK